MKRHPITCQSTRPAPAPGDTLALFSRDGVVFATSRDVAEHFGKQHGHVLRDTTACCGV